MDWWDEKTPAEKMRIARKLAALSLGLLVDDLPPDADISISLDGEGVVTVNGTIVCKADVGHITAAVKLGNRE